MIRLFHHPLSVASRFVRLILAECEIVPELIEERTWERRKEFLLLNPAGTVPVLVEHDGPPIAGAWATSEYLDETRGFALNERRLLPANADQRAEVRRLTEWFIFKFEEEVTHYLVEEKVIKRERAKAGGNGGAPNSSLLRAARANIRTHLHYIEHLIGAKNWLAGDRMSYADLAAAAALSVADYLSEVPWEDAPEAKDWYMRMKSRPAFRPLRSEQVRGVRPPEHYAELDF
ncbi:MAG TPA: glutathione S-transferase family protein [Propylenella sp.]